MDKQKQLYALGIVAHPDDESFLFAGTSLKLAHEKKRMGVICATLGEKGVDRRMRKLSMKQMAKIRVQEAKTAARIIKLSFVEFFNYPDGDLEQVNFQELVAKLVKKIDQYKPKIVLTFGREGISGHKDHVAIGQAVLAAVKKSKYQPQEVLLASVPASSIAVFNKHLITRKIHHSHFKQQKLKGVPDKKLFKVDISKYAPQKLQALKAHESQYLPEFVLGFFQKYECYEVIKLPLPAGRQVD
jgi:LmbE family N-acetylglucosaminyl deacetylase